ncbi:KxYKxGKxW signal peptide domain-containing protein [Algoriphagus persicinus]
MKIACSLFIFISPVLSLSFEKFAEWKLSKSGKRLVAASACLGSIAITKM